MTERGGHKERLRDGVGRKDIERWIEGKTERRRQKVRQREREKNGRKNRDGNRRKVLNILNLGVFEEPACFIIEKNKLCGEDSISGASE